MLNRLFVGGVLVVIVTLLPFDSTRAGLDLSLGGGSFYAIDNNVFRQSTNTVIDSLYGLDAKVGLVVGNGRNFVNSSYQASLTRYSVQSAQNIETHSLRSGLGIAIGNSYKMGLSGEVKTGHDERGTLVTEYTFSETPILFRSAEVGGNVEYLNSDGNGYSLKPKLLSKRFVGLVDSERDAYLGSLTSILTRRHSGKSSWTVNTKVSGNYFSNPVYVKRSGIDGVASLGFEWNITGKSEGKLLVGWSQALFRMTSGTKPAASYVNLDWLWKRKSYNSFKASISRGLGTTVDVGLVNSIGNRISLSANNTFKSGFSIGTNVLGDYSQAASGKNSFYYRYMVNASKNIGIINVGLSAEDNFFDSVLAGRSYRATVFKINLGISLL